MIKSFNSFINDIEKNFDYNKLDCYIHTFNNNFTNNYINFYKVLLKKIKQIKNIEIRINSLIIINENINKDDIINYDSYFIVIDTIMLLGIDYYLTNNNKAKKQFMDVVSFGEKYYYYSKENFYDIINCAYSWLVYYSYNEKDYSMVEYYCNKVINNYYEVKNDPNYNVQEKDSVDICIKYLEIIKKNS